mgnify:CR=1 FL=1
MSIEQEYDELMKRLDDIEERLLSDRVIEETILSSIQTLERIFADESIMGRLTDRLKEEHDVKRLDAAVRRAMTKWKQYIGYSKADTRFPHIMVNKNGILSHFLGETKRVRKKDIRRIHEFFKTSSPILRKALKKGEQAKAKKLLEEYVTMLESEEGYLKENIDQITKDIGYDFSLHNLMVHESAHWIFKESNVSGGHNREALNEAYSFALQRLAKTFEPSYTFTPEQLRKETQGIYRMIIPRKLAYDNAMYGFMRPFIILISILVLSDAIARKDGDYSNRRLFLDSYNCNTFMERYHLIEKALANLKDGNLRSILQQTLLRTALSQLRKQKGDVTTKIKSMVDKLPSLCKDTSAPFTRTNKSFMHGLFRRRGILSNMQTFGEYIDLLRIMGYEEEARQYRDQYFKALETTLQRLADETNDLDAKIYQEEKDAIKGLMSIIDEEKSHIRKVIDGLAF